MFDLTMFFSVFCAFLAATVVMEFLSFCLGLYLTKKQMKRQKAYEEEVAKLLAEGKVPPGMDPMQAMMSGMMGAPLPNPTVSGETDVPETSTGQYL